MYKTIMTGDEIRVEKARPRMLSTTELSQLLHVSDRTLARACLHRPERRAPSSTPATRPRTVFALTYLSTIDMSASRDANLAVALPERVALS
ncbi:hypothetical protein B5X24_HaOG214152 [Helicoverpa armigera]|uniref:Uncharacterized protein n=1 Tax=Helicoverpa armigera TaxID=29058 RepID=A0A2W1B7N3_HELAM|nr:hypothetical protein B5X24_HaOG214152 [Helicoverpa armigera]